MEENEKGNQTIHRAPRGVLSKRSINLRLRTEVHLIVDRLSSEQRRSVACWVGIAVEAYLVSIGEDVPPMKQKEEPENIEKTNTAEVRQVDIPQGGAK